MTPDAPRGRPSLEELVRLARTGLPGLVGVEFDDLEGTEVRATMRVEPKVMAPNGFLHGASIVALADTACGFGCWRGLGDDARGFTTVSLTTNFMGTARDGVITCTAHRVHAGRSTEVWDATVRDAGGKAIAVFRCTQMILR